MTVTILEYCPKPLPNTDIGVSAFSSPATLQAAYKRIKNEIEGLEEAIRAWKERRNTLSITARLPSEILSNIFKCLVPASSFTFYNDDKFRWFRVTHVCAHWRRIALQCPSLWADISCSAHPNWAEEMLKRCKTAPLTFIFPLSSRNEQLVRSALTKISSIRKLGLSEKSPGDRLDPIVAELVNPAPLLETLQLSFRDSFSNHALPRDLFAGNAPRLRQLDLGRCTLPLDIPLLHSITSLKISDIDNKGTRSMNQIMLALGTMPLLESLDLRRAPPSFPISTITDDFEHTASLPHLTRIYLRGDLSVSTNVLSHLTYPAAASIVLICTVDCSSVDSEHLSTIYRPVLIHLGEIMGRSLPIRCLKAYYPGPGNYVVMRLTTSAFPGSHSEWSCDDAPQIDFTLQRPMHESPVYRKIITELLPMLWTSIPMKCLELLQMENDWNHRQVDIWPTVLTYLIGVPLKRLEISGRYGTDFLRAFTTCLPTTVPKAPNRHINQQFLTSLRKLVIKGWHFNEQVNGETLERLKICLKALVESHGVLDELIFTHCLISTDDVEALKGIIKVTSSWE